MSRPGTFQRFKFFASFWFNALFWHNTKNWSHWNHIPETHLYLGDVPIKTGILGYGQHDTKIKAQAACNNTPLGLVVSCLEPWQLAGKGFLKLKPVQPQDWQEIEVEHHLLKADDFSDIEQIKQVVDKMVETTGQGRAIYLSAVHPEFSAAIAVCYLISHTRMEAAEAFTHILKNRPQTSLSKEHIEIIEQYRAKHCSGKRPFTVNDPELDVFKSLTWASIFKSPVFLGVATLLLGYARYQAIAVWQFSRLWFERRATVANDKLTEFYAQKEQLSDILNDGEKAAFNSGYESGKSWTGCAKSLVTPQAYWNYRAYLAGNFAGRSSNEEIKQAVNEKLAARPSA